MSGLTYLQVACPAHSDQIPGIITGDGAPLRMVHLVSLAGAHPGDTECAPALVGALVLS
jgi:hypothetical protein